MTDLWVPDYLADNEALEWSVVDGMVDWDTTPTRVFLFPGFKDWAAKNTQAILQASMFKGIESTFDGRCDG